MNERTFCNGSNTSLEWLNLPTGRDADYRPFFHSQTHPTFRLFVFDRFSKNTAQAFLATMLLGLSRLRHDSMSLPAFNTDVLMKRLQRTKYEETKATDVAVNSLMVRAGKMELSHGVKIDVDFAIPKPTGMFHYLMMQPFGAVFEELVIGTLKPTAFVTGACRNERDRYHFKLQGIACEDSTDALMLAYVMEAHGIEFELY